MSRRATSFVLGYHGCNEKVGKKVTGHLDHLEKSEEAYDWLGPGVYFWESDPQRASEWACEKAGRAKPAGSYTPYVVGAVIDLGNCLDLTLRENLALLKSAYHDLKVESRRSGTAVPKNKDPKGIRGADKLLRYRDCAVIRRLHGLRAELKEPPFDTVRGLFLEGQPVFPGARIYEKTHTQIAVLNHDAIKEVFIPKP